MDTAISSLRDYAKKLKQSEREITEQLAEYGKEVVDGAYSMGDALDISEYSVDVRRIPSGHAIVATGDNVMFLEFGTGVMTEDCEEKISAELPPIKPGEWSQNEGIGQFVPGSHEYWFYGKENGKSILWTGTPATKGFYYANELMKKQAESIVKKAVSKI